MFTLECAGCTAPISEVIVEKGVHRCPFCGYVNVLPKPEQTSEVKHHLYNADEELKDYEFERAYNALPRHQSSTQASQRRTLEWRSQRIE